MGYPVIPAVVHIDSAGAYESTKKLVERFGGEVFSAYEQALMNVDKIPE